MTIFNPEVGGYYRIVIGDKVFTNRWWERLNISQAKRGRLKLIMHGPNVSYSRYDEFQTVWFRREYDANVVAETLADLYDEVKVQCNERVD